VSSDDGRGALSVERYEQLRADVVSGEAGCFRLGLAMLQRRGVAAWSRAGQTTAPARAPAPPATGAATAPQAAVIELPGEARQLVDALATIVLASTATG
jgi:hypothetical protein